MTSLIIAFRSFVNAPENYPRKTASRDVCGEAARCMNCRTDLLTLLVAVHSLTYCSPIDN